MKNKTLPKKIVSALLLTVLFLSAALTVIPQAKAQPLYYITVTADSHSNITPASNYFEGGTSQTFTIYASQGYEITDVKVDGVSVGIISTYTFSNIQAIHNITCTSAISNYTIYASADTHCSISPSGSTVFTYGQSQTYTITANTGYTIQAVYVDNTNVGTVSTYTFSSISAGHTIYATTSSDIQYQISTSTDGNSVISLSLAYVPIGNSQTFTISPNTNYYINDVLVDGVSVGAVTSYTFTNVIAQHNITVESSSYSMTLIGPYYDSGNVAPTSVNATIMFSNGISEIRVFNGTTGSATTFSFNATVIPSYITWQISTGSNYSRTLNFHNLGVLTTYNINIPDVYNSVAGMYSFQVVSFTQITNAYLATVLNGHLIEQISLNNTGTPSFIMQQNTQYTLLLTCDQGSITRTFLAQTSYAETFTISANDFPTSAANTTTATATRPTNTSLLMTYSDPDSLTSWVYVQVTHLSGSTVVIDYTDNQTVASSYSNTITISATTDYFVTLIAYKDGAQQTWAFTCAATPTGTNPFEGLLDFLFGGLDLPFDVAQLIPAFIILLFLSIGSFRSAGFSCFSAWVVTCIFAVMGWWTATIPSLAFAGFLSIIIAINEAKETTREV